MMQLERFRPEYCARLIQWIPDARVLLQRAEPACSWPLERRQVLYTIDRSGGTKPPQYMFKAFGFQPTEFKEKACRFGTEPPNPITMNLFLQTTQA